MIEWDDEKTGIVWDDEGNSTSLLEDVKLGLAGATNALDTGITLAGRGLEKLVGYNRSIEDEDALFRNMQQRQADRTRWANPNGAKQSLAGELAGTVATLPAQILALPGQAAERGKQLIDMGESTSTAQKAVGVDTAVNMVSAALPASFGKALATKIATGAGANAGLGALSDLYTTSISEQEETKKAFDPLDPRRRAVEAIIGGGVGAAAYTPKKKIQTKSDTKAAIDNLVAKPQEPEIPKQELTNETTQLDLFDQPEMGRVANPYEAKLGDWRVDENGIPIKADLSMELQNLQNPLQGNLWGDELTPVRNPVGQSATLQDVNGMQMEPRGLTDAIDSMDPVARTAAINERMVGEINDGPLKAAVMEAETRPFVPKGQRGAISPDLLGIGKVLDLIDRVGESKALEKFKGAFSHVDLSIKNAKDPTGNTDLIMMEPEQFRKLAYPYEPGWDDHHEILRDSIREGLKSDRGLTDIPIIRLSPDGKVIGHEGRHRSDVFLEQGVDKIPVEIVWEKYDSNGKLERFVKPSPEEYPTHVVNEKGDEIVPFPYKPIQFGTVPKSQRGGAKGTWNPYAVKQRISAMTKAVTNAMTPKNWKSPLAEPEQLLTSFTKIPGMKDLDTTYLKDNLDVETVVNQIAKENDSKAGSALVGGTRMLAEIKNSTMLYATYYWNNLANKKAAYFDREFVKPFERALERLYKKDQAEDFHYLLMKEAENKTRFTPEQLREKGIPEPLIEAHALFRKMMDETLTAENQARQRLGEPPVEALDAYMAARWQGPWRAPVYDSKGKLVWYVAESSKKRAENAIAFLAEKFDINPLDPRSKIVYTKQRGERTHIEAGYREMVKLLGKDDPAVQAIRQALEDMYKSEGKQAFGQEKHFEKKSGVRGFAGDRPWMDKNKDIKEFFRENVTYARNGLRWSQLQEAVDKVKKITSDERVAHQENNIRFAREAQKNYLGYGSDPKIKSIEDWAGKYWSNNVPVSVGDAIDVAKSAFYIKTLGVFNVPFTIASLVQPVFTSPWHTKLATEGYSHNPLVTHAKGVKGAIELLMDHLKDMAPDAASKVVPKITDSFVRDASEYVRQNGIIDITQFSDIQYIGSPKLQAATKILGANMSGAEAIARSIAFMGFAEHLRQSGKYTDNAEIFKKAEDLTNLSMVDYRHFERAPVFNRLGVVGNALATLQTFKINQLNQLYLMSKEAADGLKNGNVKKALPLAHLMALQMTMAGAMGFFAVETLDAFWELLKKGVATATPRLYTHLKDTGIKQNILEHLPDWLAYGGVSAATGINWSNRFDAGTVVDPAWDALAPFIAEGVKSAGDVAKFAMSPNKPNAAEMAYQLSPASLKGPVELAMFKGETRPDGKTMFQKPTDYYQGSILRTPEQMSARKWGGRELEEAKEKERFYRDTREEGNLTTAKTGVAEGFRKAVFRGDMESAKSHAMNYASLGGDVNTIFSNLPEAAIRMHTTPLERIYMQAKNATGAQKAERFK